MIRAALAAVLSWSPAALAGDLAFITSQNGNAVSVIDLASQQIVASADVPDAPAPVAYDPARGRAYVVAANTGRLLVLDDSAQVIGGADLGEGAFGIAVAPDGTVFVADWFGARLLRLDDDQLKIHWSAATGAAPAGVAVSPDGRIVATADRDDDQISLFDAETGDLLRRVKTAGAHPFGITFHDDRLWTADVLGDSVSVIDPQMGQVLGAVPTGNRPYGVAFAGGRGFVTNQYASSITVFDDKTLAVIATVPCGDYPEGIAALPDGSGVIFANWDSDSVQVLNAGTLEITAEIPMPAGPRAFGAFTGQQIQP